MHETKTLAKVLLLIMGIVLPSALDAGECADLARTIAYDYLWEVKAVSDRGAFSAEFCSTYERNRDSSTGITIPIYNVPVTLSHSEAQYLHSTLCDRSSSWFESRDYLESARHVVNPGAMEAVKLCLEQRAIGLQVTTMRTADTLVVSIHYVTPPGLQSQAIKITGITWDATLRCEGSLATLATNAQASVSGGNTPDTVLNTLLDTRSRSIRCSRQGVLNPPASCGDQTLRHEGGELFIETTAGAVTRSLPAEVSWRTDLTARVAELSQQRENLQAIIDGTTANLDCRNFQFRCDPGYKHVDKLSGFRVECCRAVLRRPD